jgi:DNA-binding YbaB/EbfC family protein
MKIGNLNDIMKQAQLMQEKMRQVQDEIAGMEIRGESGAGMVSVVMTGRHDVKRVTLDPSLMKEDKQVLEDLVAAAMNDAVRRTEQATQEKLSRVTGGVPLPPGFKIPF